MSGTTAPINEILPFGLAVGSNVMPQASYATLGARTAGFQAGVAQSAQVNKALRQSAFIAAMIGQFTADRGGRDVLDNGDLVFAQASFVRAIVQIVNFEAGSGGGDYATKAALAAVNTALSGAIGNEGTTRGAQDSQEASIRAAADTAEATARAKADLSESTSRQAVDNSLLATFASYAPLSSFGGSFGATSGFQKSPSGMILQWAEVNTRTGAGDLIPFPIAFPTNVFSIVVCEGNAAGWGNPPSPTVYGASRFDRTAFKLWASSIQSGSNAPVYSGGIESNYIAIGA